MLPADHSVYGFYEVIIRDNTTRVAVKLNYKLLSFNSQTAFHFSVDSR